MKVIKRLALVFLAVIMASTAGTSLASAADQSCSDNSFYRDNNIFYFCENFVACGTDSIEGLPVTSDNTETILRYFTGKGFSLAAAAGIVGNLNAESSLNPAKIQGERIAPDNYTPVSGVGFGLAQWTSPDRQQKLESMANSEHKPITDLGMQLDYLWKELNDSYPQVIKSLASVTNDPVVAAIRFHGMTDGIRNDARIQAANPPSPGYESSGDTADMVIKNRGGYAASVYKDYTGKIADGSGVSVAGGASGDNGDISTSATTCNSSSDADLGKGTGQFTDGGQVAGYQTVLANAQASEKAFGTKLVWSGKCLAIVSDVWNGQVTYGKASATAFWEAYKNVGHTDKSPKVGSVLLLGSGNPNGHIVIYLGNNKVLNDGHIDDATVIQGGSFQYRGWVDPNDIGWKPRPITDIRKAVRQDILSAAGL